MKLIAVSLKQSTKLMNISLTNKKTNSSIRNERGEITTDPTGIKKELSVDVHNSRMICKGFMLSSRSNT